MGKKFLITVITMFCRPIIAADGKSTVCGSLTNMKPFGKHRYKTDCAYYAAKMFRHQDKHPMGQDLCNLTNKLI